MAGEGRSVQIRIRLNPGEAKALDYAADAHGITRSDFLRWALRNLLRAEGHPASIDQELPGQRSIDEYLD